MADIVGWSTKPTADASLDAEGMLALHGDYLKTQHVIVTDATDHVIGTNAWTFWNRRAQINREAAKRGIPKGGWLPPDLAIKRPSTPFGNGLFDILDSLQLSAMFGLAGLGSGGAAAASSSGGTAVGDELFDASLDPGISYDGADLGITNDIVPVDVETGLSYNDLWPTETPGALDRFVSGAVDFGGDLLKSYVKNRVLRSGSPTVSAPAYSTRIPQQNLGVPGGNSGFIYGPDGRAYTASYVDPGFFGGGGVSGGRSGSGSGGASLPISGGTLALIGGGFLFLLMFVLLLRR